ncbi:MAG: YeeE/YedE family protein [Rhodobacterales bacterium]|nr:YeeE/YedE family protein [Rhodobacterales bacterium]
MNRQLSALVAGLIFGLGIAISGMGNPAKVLNFFDPLGTWDPSLAFVMGGALATTAVGYRVIFGRRQAPLFDTKFHLPTTTNIDAALIGGSALFGVGWGISGFCPGGAIPALGFAPWPTALFLICMGGGILLARRLKSLHLRQTA